MASLAARTAYDAAPTNDDGPLAGRGVDVGGRHDLVGEADGERLLGVDEATAEDDLLGARGADEARQALRAAGARDDAEEDLRLAELRVVGDDAEVARQGELAASAEGVAGDRGDDRLGDARDGT